MFKKKFFFIHPIVSILKISFFLPHYFQHSPSSSSFSRALFFLLCHILPIYPLMMDSSPSSLSFSMDENLNHEFKLHFQQQKNKQLNLLKKYKLHLRNFNWTFKWFTKWETFIIKILYYPDLSFYLNQGIEFIREKIQNLHVWDFNDFLVQECGHRRIDNHYDMMKNLLRPQDLDWNKLSKNPQAIPLLKIFFNFISWPDLSLNPNAMEILEDNFYYIDWKNLCRNPHPRAIELLRENPEFIDWTALSANPAAIDLLKENPEKIIWENLSKNPAATELLKNNLEHVVWYFLSDNPGAIELLKAHPDKIDWGRLSKNPHPEAIKWLLDNMQKIDWENLSANPGAIEWLADHPEKIDFMMLGRNPSGRDLILKHREHIDQIYFYRHPVMIDLLMEKIHRDEAVQHIVYCLSGNSYDYLREKIQVFNNLPLFKRTQIKIKI